MADRYNGSSTKTFKPTAGYLHRPSIHSTLKKSFNACALLCQAKRATVIVLALLLVAASGPAYAESGRIQITLDKTGYGSGNLFYEAQKYGLSISGIKVSGFRITKIDLTGTALNLNSAADIIGTYAGGDTGVSISRACKNGAARKPQRRRSGNPGSKLESQIHSESGWNNHKDPWVANVAGMKRHSARLVR